MCRLYSHGAELHIRPSHIRGVQQQVSTGSSVLLRVEKEKASGVGFCAYYFVYSREVV